MSVYTNNADAAAFSSALHANVQILTTKKIKRSHVFQGLPVQGTLQMHLGMVDKGCFRSFVDHIAGTE